MEGSTQVWGGDRSLSSTASWEEVNRQRRDASRQQLVHSRSLITTMSSAVPETRVPHSAGSARDHPCRPRNPVCGCAAPKASQQQRARHAGRKASKASQQQRARRSGGGRRSKGTKSVSKHNVQSLNDCNTGHFADHSLITQDYVVWTHTKESLEHTARVAFGAGENRD